MADLLSHRLVECFWDDSNGGLWQAINVDGSVSNAEKFCDCQAYAIYALCAYYHLSGEKKVLQRALALFEYVEKNALSDRSDSYLDRMRLKPGRDGNGVTEEPAAIRSLHTHLHLFEAYCELYRLTKESDIRKRLNALFNLLVDHFYGDGLFYAHLSADLRPLDNMTFYGMNLQTAWLLIEVSNLLSRHDKIQKAHAILAACASKTLAVAVDDDGAVYFKGKGCRPEDHTKQWWVQAESAVAFLIAYEKSLKEHYFDAFLMTWDFIFQYLVDWKIGEWRVGVTKKHQVMADDHRAGFWKCPYHNTRACLEALKRIDLIGDGLKICAQKESQEDCFEPSVPSEFPD